MHILNNASRRVFLRQAGALSAMVGSTATPLAMNLAAIGNAAAQGVSDYKAIVCLFYFGGNDSFNMVLPTDAASYNNYFATRNLAPDPIALLVPGTAPNLAAAVASPARLGGVIPINPTNAQGRSFALHPLMTSVQTLFNVNKRLAVLPNIGPLMRPTTKAQYNTANFPKPALLFSHNDQQNTWMALGPEGSTRGWGGLMGDLAVANGANSMPLFTAISATGNSVWLAGDGVKQYQVSSTGAIQLGVNSNGQVYGSTDVGAALQRMATTARTGNLFEADAANMARRSIDAEAVLRTALRAASDPLFGTAPATGAYNPNNDPKLRYLNPLNGAMAANTLAQQFQVVARMIDASLTGGVGARRQVFFVSIGGFDTHDGQNRSHADLYARIDQALKYFDDTLGGMNARNLVTTFTASDFGRTFTSNGDGTDHGWGSHHFVMGGAVNGGDLYGKFPVLGLKNTNNNNFDSSPDQLGSGSLLPATAVDQLGATLGRWFGLSDSQVLSVFPNLQYWNAADRYLNFLPAPAAARRG
jgi:uncharacterized protein (DUF1501 family)